MTRIIAGFAGSLTLSVPRTGTRPTSERIREAIFSSLESRDALAGARVLDLYAGSGALGLEAASRGAASVVLVEKHSGAVGICRRNALALAGRAAAGSAPTVEVVARAVRSYLETASQSGRPFDVVFLDPPYDLTEDELSADLTLLSSVLARDAVVVVERSSRSPRPTWSGLSAAWRSRTYGDTTVWTVDMEDAADAHP